MAANVSAKLYNFVATLVGNRVFDLCLKYIGIKLRQPRTRTGCSFSWQGCYGRIFKDNLLQQGGVKNLPVLDDPLIGNPQNCWIV